MFGSTIARKGKMAMKPASALQSLECILIFCEPQWCNGVPLPATLDASIEARRPRGTHLGASETPAPAALPFAAVSMAALSSACALEGGAALAADRRVRRRLVLRAPLPQRRRLEACEVHVGRICANALAARP